MPSPVCEVSVSELSARSVRGKDARMKQEDGHHTQTAKRAQREKKGRRDSLGALSRRSDILSVLCARRKDTYENLALEFNVSTRTIQDDIHDLSLYHPIEVIRGKGGGVKLMDGYYPPSVKMTKEQTALCVKLAQQLSGEELEIMHSILRAFAGIIV